MYATFLISAFLCIPVFAENSESRVFIPDRNVEKIAQEYDRIYFPLFLKALEEIESGDTSLINKYFTNNIDGRDDKLVTLPPLADFHSEITPIYFHPIERVSFEIPFPIKWINPDYPDPSWNLWFKSLRWLNNYISSPDHDTVLVALKVIDDYILNHTKYPDSRCRFIFGDHASAERLLTMVRAWNRYKQLNFVIPKFENRLKTYILAHIFFTASLENYNSWHNHAIITDRSIIFALRELHEFNKRMEFIQLAFKRIFEVYRYSYTLEGVHKEHSPCYHRSFTNSLDNIILNAEELEIETPDIIIEIAKKARYYNKYISINEYAIPIGDCQRIVTRSRQSEEFVHGFKTFPISGWTFIKDTLINIGLISQSNFHSFAHYQQQETSFILNVDGHELIIDPGLLTYNRASPYYEYMRSAKGHNVLLVDGQGFDSKLENTGLAGITRYYQNKKTVNSSNGIVEMTHPHYHEIGADVHRQLAFIGNNTIIVRDIVSSETKRKYKQQFHLSPGASITQQRQHFIIRWDEHPYYLKISSNAEDYSLVEGEMDPVQGWYFPAFNQAEPCPLMILKAKGSDTEIVTRIEVFKEGVNKKKFKTKRREIRNLFNGLESKEQRQLQHEPFPRRWRPNR